MRLPGGLDGLVSPDTPTGEHEGSVAQQERLRALTDFSFRSHGRLVVSEAYDFYVQRNRTTGRAFVFGKLRLNGEPAGRWEVELAVDDEGPTTATIKHLAVRGRLHGQGIGSGWLRQLEQNLADAGVSRIDLFDASHDNQRRSFWRERGYTRRAGAKSDELEKLL
jgi:GNAT superfamily N-acetyltransferase